MITEIDNQRRNMKRAWVGIILAVGVVLAFTVPAEARRGRDNPPTTTTVAPTTTTKVTTTVAPTTTAAPTTTITVPPLCYDHLTPVYDPDVCTFLAMGGVIWSE